MIGPTLSTKVLITNPQGLHMRPAAAFVSLAKKFACTVQVIKDDQRVDGKSVLNLLSLGALEGTELTIEACGADASEALPALVEVVNLLAEDSDSPPANPVC